MDAHVRDLRYFVVVAREWNFTRAAERLFVSQPALSKQIRMLESQLRVQLFVRDRRTVQLTTAGEVFLPLAERLVQDWDVARTQVIAAAAAGDAVLRVGFSTSIGRGLVPRIQAEFEQLRPGWRLELRQIPWTDPTAGVAGGDTDVAIVWLPVPDGFLAVIVAEEPRWVALPHTHPLSRREAVEFGDLLDEPFLALPEDAGPLRDYWLALDSRGGRPVRIGAVVSNAEETFEAVANGAGVALLSAGNAELYQRPDIIARPVSGISGSQLAVIWATGDARAAVRDFATAARTLAS
jgi:DNA-binding transcriptional LysR family regulator